MAWSNKSQGVNQPCGTWNSSHGAFLWPHFTFLGFQGNQEHRIAAMDQCALPHCTFLGSLSHQGEALKSLVLCTLTASMEHVLM